MSQWLTEVARWEAVDTKLAPSTELRSLLLRVIGTLEGQTPIKLRYDPDVNVLRAEFLLPHLVEVEMYDPLKHPRDTAYRVTGHQCTGSDGVSYRTDQRGSFFQTLRDCVR